MKKILSVMFASLMVLGIVSFGFSQQTGSLKGTITDDQGNGLPGVNVSLTSPAMQGTQSYSSAQGGDYRFPILPPGIYSLKVELSGFQRVERGGIQVRVGATTTVDVQMKPATLNEQVTVTAVSPIVDVESTNISVTISKDAITNLPIRRDVLDLYQSAPATVPRDASNDYQKSASVAGGSLEQSKIAIDGVDLMDTSRGYISADISFDAIDEAEMVVGGLKAEVGQASAGFLNVVTKSGGNTLSGSLTVGGTNKSLGQIIVPKDVISTTGLLQPQIKKYKYDIGLGLGGPIIRDKIWFFVAPRFAKYEQSTYFVPFTDPDGIYHAAYPNIRKDTIGLGKITIQFTKSLKWFGMYQYNNGYETPQMWAVTKVGSPMESQKAWDDGSHTVSSVLTLVMNQNTFVEGRFGMVLRNMYLPYWNKWEGPATRGTYFERTTGQQWGHCEETDYLYDKDTWNGSLAMTRFQDNFLGADHEIKIGGEYSYSSNNRRGGRYNPYTYYYNNFQPWYLSDTQPYRGQVMITNVAVLPNRSPYLAKMYRMSFFFQDTFNLGKRLSVNLGLRYDYSNGYVPATHWEGYNDTWQNGLANVLLPQIFLPAGQTLDAPAMNDLMVYKALSPRLGLSYDLFGNGQTILRASIARYGDALLTTAVERLIPLSEKSVTFTWTDNNHDGKFDLPPIDSYVTGSYQPYSTDTATLRKSISSDIKTPTTDELTLGVTQAISKDFSLALNFVTKRGKNMLGAINLNIAKNSEWWIPYTVTDPGDDGKLNTGNEQNLTVFMLRTDAPTNLIQTTNIADATRKYWGFNLIFNKRMSNGWMFNGSVAISKAYGNYANGYLNFSGSQAFWDPNSDINREGRMEFDRPLIIKLMTTVELPLGFMASGYFRYYSGAGYSRQVTVYFPTTYQGYKPRSSSVTVFAEPQRERSFMPEAYLDLRLEKTFKLNQFTVGVFADLFNLFGYYYSLYGQNQLTGGYIYADGSFARYGRYGLPDAIYGTREFALGARVRF